MNKRALKSKFINLRKRQIEKLRVLGTSSMTLSSLQKKLILQRVRFELQSEKETVNHLIGIIFIMRLGNWLLFNFLFLTYILVAFFLVLLSAIMPDQNSPENFIMNAPGGKLLKLAEFLYSRKALERIFSPIITDMRDEYFEAILEARSWKARWVHFRGVWSFFAAVVTDIPLSLVGLVVKLWIAAK